MRAWVPFDSFTDDWSLPSIRPLASLGTGRTPLDSVAWPAMSELRGMPKAGREASRMVRKGGFEPPHSCECQPLKLPWYVAKC